MHVWLKLPVWHNEVGPKPNQDACMPGSNYQYGIMK